MPVGGNNNSGIVSVASLVGAGAGAGIANYAGGTTYVTSSVLDFNQSRSGVSNTATGSGSLIADLGAGGAIFNYLGSYQSF